MLQTARSWCLTVPLVAFGCATASTPSAATCMAAGPLPDVPDGGEFVAYENSFDGFHCWNDASATAMDDDDAGDGLHGVGPLQVYWNQNPPHGSTDFPVGTIIVKESQQADVTQRVTFAMVKRGGGFNSGGAVDWEWYSLQDHTDGSVNFLWSGLAALSMETYANQPIGDCNGCHSVAEMNDFVWDSALQLSNF
jgi:hypothetical protein